MNGTDLIKIQEGAGVDCGLIEYSISDFRSSLASEVVGAEFSKRIVLVPVECRSNSLNPYVQRLSIPFS